MADKTDNKNKALLDSDDYEYEKQIYDKQKQQEQELEAKRAALREERKRREKEEKREHERQLAKERIELMKHKGEAQNSDGGEDTKASQEQSDISGEDTSSNKKKSVVKKADNFFYHNKWWLGLAVFFVFLGSYLIYDIVTKPRPDMIILMLCDNAAVGNSVYLEEYFSEFGEDSNKNGKTEVSVYYIPYGDDDYANYQNGVTNKLTTYLNNDEGIMIIGNEKTITDLIVTPEESLIDLSTLYPDNPHVQKYFFYLKDTDFAEKLGIPKSYITDDMFFALRKPKDLMDASQADMQKTYDKDIATFERIISDLT